MAARYDRAWQRAFRSIALITWCAGFAWLASGAGAQNTAQPPPPATQSAAPAADKMPPPPGPVDPVIGIPKYVSPSICEFAKPDSVTLKQALLGRDFEPLSEARRSILDCVDQVQAVIIQTQKDLPAAESKLDRALENRRLFNETPSPDDEIKYGDRQLEQLKREIQELEKQLARPAAPSPAETPIEPPPFPEDVVLSPAQTLESLKSDQRYFERRVPELEAQRESYGKEKLSIENAVAEAEAIKARLTDNLSLATKDDQLARNTLDRVDDRIDQMLSINETEGRYKLWLSVAFAGLIGVVIGGFFWLAKSDQVVLRQIFSGDAGLQFVTLFALVIAIILFGIVGILEGRELSALLGGISGYILGRTSSALEKKNQPPAPAAPATP